MALVRSLGSSLILSESYRRKNIKLRILTKNTLFFSRIETDSPSRLAWNSYFVVVNNSITPSMNLLTDAFAVRASTMNFRLTCLTMF